MTKFSIFLFIYIILNTGCDVYLKNRVQIEGGKYRVMSYDSTNVDSVINIRSANKNDSILGIGVCLNTKFISDRTRTTTLINTTTQGEQGVIDSIKSIKVLLNFNDITESFTNKDSDDTDFLLDDNLYYGSAYEYTDFNTKSYSTFSFKNIEDFVTRYNQNEEFGHDNLEKEFFFWLSSSQNLTCEELKELDFTISFSDGRVIKLDYWE